MAYLSLSQKLSINRIATTTDNHPAGDCVPETYELNLELASHLLSNPGAGVPGQINRWKDSSDKGRDFIQLTDAAQPSWTGYGYSFDGNNENMEMLGTAPHLTIHDDFTIGFAVKMSADTVSNLVTIADASSANDFIRIKNIEEVEVKADGQLRTVVLDDSLPDGDPVGIVITRTSGTMSVYIDGVRQGNQASFSGTKPLDIDTIGCRNNQINDFIGDIGQIIIYSCSELATVLAVIRSIDDTRVQMIQ